MEQKAGFSFGRLAVRLGIVVPIVDLEEHLLLDEVCVLGFGQGRDNLPDQLLERLNVKRVRNELTTAAHLQECADFHLSVLLFDIALFKDLFQDKLLFFANQLTLTFLSEFRF